MANVTGHRLVVQTAKEMAQALYEDMAKDNAWYAEHPDQNEWVERVHGSLLEQARAQLASMLGMVSTPEHAKERIYEALMLDKSLQRKGNHVFQTTH